MTEKKAILQEICVNESKSNETATLSNESIHSNGGGDEGMQQHPVEIDHFITFITTVKKRFANEPQIYQEFLDALHSFKQKQWGNKDVLEKVSILFADHPDLLIQFTTFLADEIDYQS